MASQSLRSWSEGRYSAGVIGLVVGQLQLWRGEVYNVVGPGDIVVGPEAVESRLVGALRLVRDDAALTDGAHDLHDLESNK
jgi:hypothetical protein